MPFEIQDGKGRGYRAEVNVDNLLRVNAITEDESEFVSIEFGDAYSFATNFMAVQLTGAQAGCIFVKNERSQNFVVDEVRVSTNVNARFRVYRNPANLSSGNATTGVNLNFGSNKVFEGTAVAGSAASTLSGVSGGNLLEQIFLSVGPQPLNLDGVVVLGNGDSIGVTVELSSTAIIGTTVRGHYTNQS